MKRILVAGLAFLLGSCLFGQTQGSQTSGSPRGVELKAAIGLKLTEPAAAQTSSELGSKEKRLFQRAQQMNLYLSHMRAWKDPARGTLRMEWTGQNKCWRPAGERFECLFQIRLLDGNGDRVAYFVSRPLEPVDRLVASEDPHFMEFKLDERELRHTSQVEFSYWLQEF